MHNVKHKMYFYEENLHIMQSECINLGLWRKKCDVRGEKIKDLAVEKQREERRTENKINASAGIRIL